MYGLNAKLQYVGYVKTEYPESVSLHDVKSYAGGIFHEDNVISVCVFDDRGTARLYLKKTDNGVIREER